MNEHKFSAKMAKSLRGEGVYVWKINANFVDGIPDMWARGNAGRTIWVENKWLHALPKRASTLITPALSAMQDNWLTEQHLHGVRVMVVCGSPDGCIFFEQPDDWRRGKTKDAAIEYRELVNYLCRELGINRYANEPENRPHAPDRRPSPNRRTPQTRVAA